MRVPHSPTAQAVSPSIACTPNRWDPSSTLRLCWRLPGLAAVLGAEDRSRTARRPSRAWNRPSRRSTAAARVSVAPFSQVSPPSSRPVDRPVIARGDDALVVDHGDREEVVEDVDLALGEARREVEDVAARPGGRWRGEDGGGDARGAGLRHEKQTPWWNGGPRLRSPCGEAPHSNADRRTARHAQPRKTGSVH